MADKKPNPALNLGIYGRRGKAGANGGEIAAIALTVLWCVGVGYWLFVNPSDEKSSVQSLGLMMRLLTIFLPVSVIWIGALAMRSARIMRAEAGRLQAAIDALRQTYVAQAQTNAMGVQPSLTAKLDQIAAAQKQTESAIATFSSQREAATPHRPAAPIASPIDSSDSNQQPTLALGPPAEEIGPSVSVQDFIRALNFPETAEDKAGFSALRSALKDRQTAKLIQAAQDVLTLLSQDGIYMDDLHPDRARPDIWRKFAGGARGRGIAALGGVRDRASLALAAGRMRQDSIFRDATHHFLREFDKTFARFEKTASDLDISTLSDTRSARAFMLLGRVAGTFD